MGIDAVLTRRTILAVSAATLTTAHTCHQTWAEAGRASFLSAARVGDDKYALFGISARGDIVFRHNIPSRGHAATAHPHRAEAVAFARRPGRFGLVIHCGTGAIAHQLAPPKGRHFYGHGAYSADGTTLLTTENDIASGSGMIGLWSAEENYRRIGERPSGGIGPHEIVRLVTGGFAVANGGIRTHPDTGREKLNLDTMRPNLTYLDDGFAIADQIETPPELQMNSLRHLAAHPNGLVAVAAQWQGDLFEAPPLLALHAPGEALRFLDAGMARQRDMNGYAGSVAFRGDGRQVAVTSPRGGVVHSFNLDGDLVAQDRHDDICGLSSFGDGYLATSGNGQIWSIGASPKFRVQHNAEWDNHVVAI